MIHHAAHVGSFLRPQRLIEAARQARAGNLDATGLRAVQDECIREIVALQESLGFSTVTDGEFRRRSWSAGFIDAVEGFGLREGTLGFRTEARELGVAMSPYARQRIRRTRGIATDEFRFLHGIARSTPKITMPAPDVMHFFLGPRSVEQAVYPEMQNYFADAALLRRVRTEFPESAHVVLGHGVRRLIDYQDVTYASLYLDRLVRFRHRDPELLAAVARHLAVRMSFEDIVRVAQAKTRPARLARIRAETGAAPEEPVVITELFKPGFSEVCDILPERLARRLLNLAERRPGLQRIHRAMHVRTTTLWGYARLRILARLRPWRWGTWRFRREQEAIGDWLEMIEKASRRDMRLASEIAECARLIKGYGDTHRHGLANYQRIVRELIGPALQDAGGEAAAAKIAAARTAALADPEGKALEKELMKPDHVTM